MLLPTATAVCLLLFLSSCAGYQEVQLVGMRDAQVTRFDGGGFAGRVQVDIHNPNPYRIKVKDPDVDLYVNDMLLGKATLDSTIVLERNSTLAYSIPLHAKLNGGQGALLPMMMTLLGGQVKLGVKGTVVGKVGFLRHRFPFEAEQQIDLNDR